ncbi:MAG: hypothetical protein AAB443_01965 [Patescibacteria group bacterium]
MTDQVQLSKKDLQRGTRVELIAHSDFFRSVMVGTEGEVVDHEQTRGKAHLVSVKFRGFDYPHGQAHAVPIPQLRKL